MNRVEHHQQQNLPMESWFTWREHQISCFFLSWPFSYHPLGAKSRILEFWKLWDLRVWCMDKMQFDTVPKGFTREMAVCTPAKTSNFFCTHVFEYFELSAGESWLLIILAQPEESTIFDHIAKLSCFVSVGQNQLKSLQVWSASSLPVKSHWRINISANIFGASSRPSCSRGS